MYLSIVVGSDVWLPPQSGYLKLNVDASVSPESDHIGISAVIRDEKGRILGIGECYSCGGNCAINVVSAVSDNTEFSLEGPILEDVKQLFAQLWNPGVYHIWGNANHVAHL
ncbi:hypothetical protein TIFTF001_039540 [Ficus carica]|uniref:RNase H type-1 domain-containing protein n=1 Tax=Ficus carica TaxID=3494 RepID=A0AA88EB06_FICCA|nr:hypothetical protein TIFTF001_039540 [Ficus carica]